jgi:hypothetical protein
MGTGKVECELNVSVERAWAVVGDFEHPGTFITDLQAIEIEGDIRILTLPGMQIREQLLEKDDVGHRLVYSVREGIPVTSHRGEITVVPTSTGSRVIWAFDVTPDAMVGPLKDVYAGGLAALKKHFAEE